MTSARSAEKILPDQEAFSKMSDFRKCQAENFSAPLHVCLQTASTDINTGLMNNKIK